MDDKKPKKSSRSASASSSSSNTDSASSSDGSSSSSASSSSSDTKESEKRKIVEAEEKNIRTKAEQPRNSHREHQVHKTDRRVDDRRDRVRRSRSRSPRRNDENPRIDRRSDRDRYSNHSQTRRHHDRDDNKRRHHDHDENKRRHHDEIKRHDDRASREKPIKVEPNSPAEEDRIARRENERKREETRRNRDREGEGPIQWGKPEENVKVEEKPIEKEKPTFELSGNLAADTNTYNGVVVKYVEPPEARKPKIRWRLYPFKGEESLPVYFVHRQSAYLFGKDRRVADIGIDHPSCSKQHAVLQFRLVSFTKEDGSKGRRVRPYVIDLGSANGTFVNGKKIDSQRYYELFEKDVIKFAFSTRDYVIMNEAAEDSPKSDLMDEDEGDDVEFDPSRVKKEPA